MRNKADRQAGILVKPVPEHEFYDIARAWVREGGITPDAIVSMSQERNRADLLVAMLFNFTYFALGELVSRDYISPTPAGGLALRKLVRQAHKLDFHGRDGEREHWKGMKRSLTDIYRIGILDILYPQPPHWESLWAKVLNCSGYEGFSVHDVNLTILMKGLGVANEHPVA